MTGGKAVAGIGGSVAALENKLKNIDLIINELKKDATAVTSRSTSASTAAEDTKKSLIRLYQANPTLKK